MKGLEWRLDFRNLLQGRHQANTFHVFRNIGFKPANDKVTFLRCNLKSGWKVRFYEHENSQDRGKPYDAWG